MGSHHETALLRAQNRAARASGARPLMLPASINAAAQWLSDHSLALTVALAGFAFAVEAIAQLRAPGAAAETQAGVVDARSHWVTTWRINALLFAVTFALSWAISPWAAPLLSQVLSARDGALSLLELPLAARLVIGFVLLDFSGYVIHRAAHRLGWWWRLHQVHHSDIALNASTHFRQHPLAPLVALAALLPLLWLLGIPAVSWVVYALISTVVQLWQHSTAATPLWLERPLHGWLATPRFHRLHHHPLREVHDYNYGVVFACWDRLFGTYQAVAPDAAESTPVGLAYCPANDALSFSACLMAPFLRPAQAAPDSLPPAASTPARPTPAHLKLRTAPHRKTL